ncbi:alpha/beta-hydrolase [Aspergillus sclerotioniger CBS 115572]|uniref:Alpha/beta-hydrolase n=1 Tax=Aspergillus sclerotioniger CBS 115572 TaxID=1450535 RepID=A0A317VKQ4_9EURO|nr:alpha/beta-hydrolase [Aspergillus sclerotioniger CBS 115572]PWY73811.1 alpha/beta-hydrolase [Aspergillus sclerotioniger CBS 115572]
MSEKPTILVIPGAFAPPEQYDAVVNAVAAQGYSIRALHLPSVGYKSGVTVPPCMEDDAAFIASEVTNLADQGRDVVLIAHSYGGIPATQSTKGLGKAKRQEQGMKGGIVQLAYMNCLVLPLGASDASVLLDSDAPPKGQMVVLKADDGWLHHSDIALSAALGFSDLPREEGEMWARKLTRHSASAFPSELTHVGYKDIPVSWLLSEDDLCIPATLQKASMAMVERESERKVDVTSIKAGHCPFISKPKLVTDWVLGVVAKVQSQQSSETVV